MNGLGITSIETATGANHEKEILWKEILRLSDQLERLKERADSILLPDVFEKTSGNEAQVEPSEKVASDFSQSLREYQRRLHGLNNELTGIIERIDL